MREENFKTIDEYINLQPESIRPKLKKIRDVIAKAVPEAKESISYRMPLFKYNGMIAYFAAFTNHYSIFVSPDVMNAFREHLEEYELSKSGIKIPNSKPVPEKLLKEIVKYAANRNLSLAELKKAAKKKK
jgi:uncharacterized protein YdhG (YjbR/CyaY superfamily)